MALEFREKSAPQSFVDRMRGEIAKQLKGAIRAGENADRPSRIERVNFMAEKVAALLAFLEEKGDQVLSMDERKAYRLFLEVMEIDKGDSRFLVQENRLKLGCINLLGLMKNPIKKYAKAATKAPKEFFLSNVSRVGFFPEKQEWKMEMVEREVPVQDEIQVIVHPYCFEFVMSDQDFKNFSNEGQLGIVPDRLLNPALENSVFVVPRSGVGSEVERHEKLHVLYHHFVEPLLPGRVDLGFREKGNESGETVLGQIVQDIIHQKAWALTHIKTECISHLAHEPPDVSDSKWCLEPMWKFVGPFIGRVQYNESLSVEQKISIYQRLRAELLGLYHDLKGYANAVRTLLRFSSLPKEKIIAILLVQKNNLDEIVAYHSDPLTENPRWGKILERTKANKYVKSLNGNDRRRSKLLKELLGDIEEAKEAVLSEADEPLEE